MSSSTCSSRRPAIWSRKPGRHCAEVLDLIEACKIEGDPQAVVAAIEEDLRARMAVPVEPTVIESR